MIPKIIHYSWFSGELYPQWISDCIDEKLFIGLSIYPIG